MRDLPASKRVLEMRRTARNRRIRLLVIFFILFLSLFFATSYFSSNSRVTIKNVVINGTRILDNKEIKQVVLEELGGKYIYLFSRANFLIYPHKQIYNELLTKFPRIEKLAINRDGFQTLNIKISERTGVYLYCGETVPTIDSNIGDNCFYINNEGFIFDRAPYFSGNIYFKYYIKLPKDSSPQGQQVMNKDEFKKMTTFVDGLIDNSFKPNYIIIDSDGSRTVYLDHKPLSTNPKIMFKENNNLSTILDNLSASMKKDEFKSDIVNKYDTLQYIDLRFKNKVLYKFND